MEKVTRKGFSAKFTILNGESETSIRDLSDGCFGAVLIPSGSDLIGKSLQFVHASADEDFDGIELLSEAMVLVAGVNHMTVDQMREAGAVCECRLSVDSAVSEDSKFEMIWKS